MGLALWAVPGSIIILIVALRRYAAEVYDVVIVWMTAVWYRAVFDKLEVGARVLDVGIGTATALARNKEVLLKKRISVVGLDYEEAYVKKAENVLRKAGLWQPVPEDTEGYMNGECYCCVYQRSIYDPGLEVLCGIDGHPCKEGATVPESQRFDAAYFSGSLTLMPDPIAALKAVVPLLKSGSGRVFITQTFQKKHSFTIAAIKPLLKHATTIDFGQLTTEEALDNILAGANDVLETVDNYPIPGSVATHLQTARIIEMKVRR